MFIPYFADSLPQVLNRLCCESFARGKRGKPGCSRLAHRGSCVSHIVNFSGWPELVLRTYSKFVVKGYSHFHDERTNFPRHFPKSKNDRHCSNSRHCDSRRSELGCRQRRQTVELGNKTQLVSRKSEEPQVQLGQGLRAFPGGIVSESALTVGSK